MKGKFPNGLAEAMAAAGIGPSALERLTGIAKQDIYKRAHQKARLTPEMAELLAPHLNTTAAGLLQLRTIEAFTVPLGGRIGAGGSIDTSTEQGEPGVEYEVEMMSRVEGATIAYQVIGESMFPAYEPDTVIICRAHTTDIAKHFGKRVALGTLEHGRQLKVVQAGSKPHLFDLVSINQTVPTMRDVEVAWVARIAAIIPPDEWRILERESQVKHLLKKPSQRKTAAKG